MKPECTHTKKNGFETKATTTTNNKTEMSTAMMMIMPMSFRVQQFARVERAGQEIDHLRGIRIQNNDNFRDSFLFHM